MGQGEQAGGRVVGLDVARGALMAWIVVVIHAIFWLRLMPFAQASIILFEMPLIFMIAGSAYFLAQRRSSQSYFAFIASRAVRILVPYFVYALACAAIMIALRGDQGAAALQTVLAWLNPVQGGAGRSAPILNWHLWFVAPFLVVMALMPLLARLGARAHAPLWSQAIGGALLVLAADLLDTTRIGVAQMCVFYALWAGFGFVLAANPNRFGLKDYALLLALSLVALAALKLIWPDQISLNMQANKFPPNAVFFIFCCAWVALIMMLVRWVSDGFVDALARNPLLRPFITGGYSIYLWQGLGYWAATRLGAQYDLHVSLVWALAVTLTVAMGMLASPLERIKLPKPAPRA